MTTRPKLAADKYWPTAFGAIIVRVAERGYASRDDAMKAIHDAWECNPDPGEPMPPPPEFIEAERVDVFGGIPSDFQRWVPRAVTVTQGCFQEIYGELRERKA